MGCWNGTCFLSGLAIRGGDKARALIIAESSVSDYHGSGPCYVSESFAPVGDFIAGSYDSYGCLGLVSNTKSTKATLGFFRDAFDSGRLVFSERANALGEIPPTSGFSVGGLIRLINNDELRIIESSPLPGSEPSRCQLFTIMLLEDSYKIVKSIQNDPTPSRPVGIPPHISIGWPARFADWVGWCGAESRATYNFMRLLDRLRRPLAPMAGAGSQSDDAVAVRDLAEAVAKLAQRRVEENAAQKAEWAREEAEEDDVRDG